MQTMIMRILRAASATFVITMAGPSVAQTFTNPFFAMDTGTRDATHMTPSEQVALVKEVGFAGVGPIYRGTNDLKQWLDALDAARLKIFALYLPLQLDAADSSVRTVKDAVMALKEHQTLIWLFVTDRNHAPSASDDDAAAVKALREICDTAAKAGLRVALYPHTGCYVQRVEDAVRLVEKTGATNLGVTFNLCHWLKVDGKDLDATLGAAKDHLYAVTINGADADGKDWASLIQPLDKGTYDAGRLLDRLAKMGYAGPIGLQHYGIKGDARTNLEHSMAAWRRLTTGASGGR